MQLLGYARLDPSSTVIEKRRPVDNPPATFDAPADGKSHWVPIIEEVVDTSTGPDTVSTRVQTIEANRVYIEVNIRDMTPGELATRDTALISRLTEIGTIDRVQFELIYELVQIVFPLASKPVPSKQAFVQYAKGKLR